LCHEINKNEVMKGQAAIEYFTIISVALLILIPLVAYLNQLLIGYRDDVRLTQASEAVNKIGENVDWVFAQGPPAKRTIRVYIPDGIESITYPNDDTINFRIKTSAGYSDVYYVTNARLENCNIPTNSGYYYLAIEAFSDHVEINVVS